MSRRHEDQTLAHARSLTSTYAPLHTLTQATDAAVGVSLEPNGAGKNAPQYEGLVVPVAAAEAVAANTSISVLYWCVC